MKLSTAAKYTRQNTGKHFLDSGDYYGRQYERGYSSELTAIDSYGTPEINLTAWLSEYAEFIPLHSQFYKWANREENREYSWFEAGENFMLERGFECVARDNIYNCENDFDQVFVYEIWENPEYRDCSDWIYSDSAIVVLYIHTGCDVRGGYSSPLFVRFNTDSGYTMPLDWQCSLYSPDLEDKENEQLQVFYSGYPLGELEKMGFEHVENNKFKHSESGREIEVFAEYYS